MEKKFLSQNQQVITLSEEETIELGRSFASQVKEPVTICLTGDLGSGKTTFVKGLAEGLGFKDARKLVSSPTFVFIREYPCNTPVYHIDLYRMEELSEVDRDMIEECINSESITIVEWGRKFPNLLPENLIEVIFKYEGKGRSISFSSKTPI